MPTFTYKAYNPEGKPLNGRRQASDDSELREQLIAEGVLLRDGSVKEVRRFFAEPRSIKLSVQEMCEVFELLEVHLGAGVHAVDAIETIGQSGSTKKIRSLMRELHGSVARGQKSLAEAFALFPRSFPSHILAIIAAGETTGALPARFKDLRERLTAFRDIRAAFLEGAIHPTVVCVAMLGLLNFLFSDVVPVLASTLEDSGYKLNYAAKRTYEFSVWLHGNQQTLGWISAAVFFALWMLWHAPANSKVALWRDALILRLPIWGSAVKSASTANIFRTYAGLSEGGVHATENLGVCSDVATNIAIRKAVGNILKDVRRELPLSEAFTKTKVFPLDACGLIRAGENGDLPNCMRRAADYHAQLVRRKLNLVLKIGQPAAMIILGIILGCIAAWYIVPIYNIGNLAMQQ